MAEKKTKPQKAAKQKPKATLGAIVRTERPKKTSRFAKRRAVPNHLALPGFVAFTRNVLATLLRFKNHYGMLVLLYAVTIIILIGFTQHEQYRLIVESVDEFGSAMLGSNLDVFSRTLGIFGVAVTGGLNASLDAVQRLYLLLITIIGWLVTVWLLRHLLAGNEVRVRDGLYNAGAPLISTLLVLALMALQALPGALGVFVFTLATQTTGIDGFAAVLFGLMAFGLVLLSLYWLASSVFALLIVTLPGSYPMAAIRAAGDLVYGRRLKLMLRLLWMGLLIVLIWAIVLTPLLLLDTWLNIEWFPLVPLFVQILGGFTLLFVTTYLYLLYREMIDEPAS